MYVAEHVGAVADRRWDVLLFDVRVERIVHRAAVRMIDFLDEPCRVGMRVQQIAFEPVQALQAQRDSCLARVLGDGPHGFDAPFPLILRGSLAGEEAQRRVERTNQVCGARRRGAVDCALVVFDPSLPHSGDRD